MVTCRDACYLLKPYDGVDEVRRGHGHDGTALTCPSSASRAVEIGLCRGRHVVVDDETDMVDVNAASRDVCLLYTSPSPRD